MGSDGRAGSVPAAVAAARDSSPAASCSEPLVGAISCFAGAYAALPLGHGHSGACPARSRSRTAGRAGAALDSAGASSQSGLAALSCLGKAAKMGANILVCC